MLTLKIPPLMERPADVPMLLDVFLDEYMQEYHKYLQLTMDARRRIYTHDWHGGVTELRAFSKRIVLLCRDKEVDAAFVARHLPKTPMEEGAGASVPVIVSSNEELEVRDALARCGGNKKRAAEMLNMSTTTLWRRMRKYGLIE